MVIQLGKLQRQSFLSYWIRKAVRQLFELNSPGKGIKDKPNPTAVERFILTLKIKICRHDLQDGPWPSGFDSLRSTT